MTPGIHSMPAEQYHSAAGVSRSMLDWIAAPKTPAHYRAKWITKEIPDEETDAMKMGTLVHRCVLEPDTMAGSFYQEPAEIAIQRARLAKLKSAKVVRDDGAGDVLVAWNNKLTECEDWHKAHGDKPVISAEDAAAIRGMRDSVWAHPIAARILKHSEFERSAFADDRGMMLKSRFDALPRGCEFIADLKTCQNADRDSVEKAIFDRGYHRQAAFYLRVAELVGLDLSAFVFIFVEKTPPYAVAVYQLDDLALGAGTMLVNRDLGLLRACTEANDWPGYSNELETAALPAWVMRQLEKECVA